MSIITYPLNGIEYTAEDAETYLSTRTSGVFSADISIIPENMTVTIGSFLAWINNKNFSGKSVAVTEPVTLNIDPAEAVLNRIDRIVLRFNAIENSSSLVVIKGNASAFPVPPAITRSEAVYDLCICEITIKSATTNLTNIDIKSTVLDENLCGIMRDGVTGIPTAQLQEQAEELILRLQEAIDSVQENSAFMIGDVYDPNKKAKPVAFEGEVLKKETYDPLNRNQPVAFDDEVLKKTGGSFVSSLIDESGQISAGYKSIYPNGASYKEINEIKLPNDIRVFTTRVIRGADYNEVTFGLSNSQNAPPLGLTVRRTEANVYSALIAANKQLFGEHNKPTGSYTGNNATSRSVSIGGFGVLFLYNTSNKIWGFVTSKGFFYTANPGGNAQTDFTTSVTFNNGVLSINNTAILNQSGQTYYYQVL